MAQRYKDWLKQAKRDLEHARHALGDREYEWSCFASQQSAEKAVKAVYQKIGADAWGHSVSILLANLPDKLRPDEEIVDLAKELDKHYISPRYPNFHPEGAPFEHYTKKEAERATDYAGKIISFCEDKLL